MSDLNRTLTDRAERGTPLGSARLRERVMLELAADASTPPRRWVGAPRPIWAFLGAVAAILVLLGTTPLLFRMLNDEGPVADTTEVPVATTVPLTTPSTTAAAITSETPTTSPATKTTVPAIPARLEMTWQQAPTQQAFGEDDVIESVVEGGPGLVAVGTAWSDSFPEEERLMGGGRNQETAVWTSTDGLTWERVTGLEGQEIVLDDVVNGPGGLVGVSARDSIYGGYEQTGPPIWISPDGTSWSRVTGNKEAFGDSATISGIAAGGPGYVAVGTDGHVVDATTWTPDAAIWTSADGLTWTRVEQGLGDGYEESIVYEVALTSSGFVAVGEGGDEGFDAYWEGDYQQGIPRPVSNFLVWTSQDGTSWDRIDFSPGEELPQGVVTIDGTTITFGYGGDLRNTLIDLDGDRLATMGHLKTGYAWGQRSWAVVWASDDGGATWFEVARLGDPTTGGGYAEDVNTGGPAGIRGITVVGDGFVAVGATGDESAPVWIGTWNED